MSSGDEEEIAEEIPECKEDDASLTDSRGESFIFPAVGLQADETSIAGILLNRDERTTVSEHIQIAETLSPSLEAKSLLNEPLHFWSNGGDPKIISPDSLTKKNENVQKEKEVEGEAMAPKKSYKSLSQHDDTLLKHHATKSCSKRDHTNSPDALTVSSDWSVESFNSHSTGNNSEYIKDRSVSEVAVSVPKLTVFSLDSACKVSSLVKQFSLQNEDLNDKTTDTGPRRQSLPVDLSQATYFEANSFISLLHDKQNSLLFDESSCSYTRKECVSSKIGYFNRQDKEEHLCDKGPRESPKKLGHLSPRVKASLEKIGTCLSRGSSIDSHIDLEERKILKSKENLAFKEASKNIPKILLASQKENTPCHKTKLKKMQQKMNKEKSVSLGKMEELGDVSVSLSECSTCISSLVNSKQIISSENKCTAQESSHPEEIAKVAAEDVCDTEEEVEDMPVEMEQNIASYLKVENEDICLNENQFSVVNSSQSSNEHCSLEPSKSFKISCVNDGEAGDVSFHNNFSETTKKKISGILCVNTDGDREVVCKKSFKFFSAENLCQSTDNNMQAAASSQLDTSDGRQSNIAAKADDGPKVDTNCGSQSSKLKERNISEASECPSQDDFPMSLENESCDELINLDIDHSGDEVFGDDFSDASEFVIELVSKSPISAITERTEESGQENENLNSRLERVSDLCSENSNESLKQTVDNSNPGDKCQSIEQKMVNESAIIPISEKHFPSLPLNIVNDSSHFTGTSSVLGDSLVQIQTSLLARNESVDPHSSQCFASVVGQYSSKPGTKAKLPILNNNLKEDKIEKNATPPSSPTIKTLYGPVRTTLHRNSSRSMHNLASSHGSVYKSQGLHNRALSLSNDNLESNSLRAKSLSPGPVPRQKMKCSPESERRGNLNRRCISAVALNENEGHVNLKRNRSFSLNKLNRSRSSSLTSISSSKKLDYSQVPSKVRQYIKEMKDKDIRNSTRSLPSTPARKKKQQATSQIVVLDEKLLRELSQFDDDEMPDDIRKIRDQIIGEKGDSKRLEDILKLLILERKSRHASDTTLAALQLRFDNLNALFAEKQNEIDRLRFYKDIQVNKEYIFSIQTQEERIVTSDRSSHNTTAPNTPNKSTHHYLISPNMTRRSSSYQTTPPNTPNIRSLSPTLSHSNIIKTTSTPIADPNWTFAYDPNSSYMFQESFAGGVSRVQCSMVSGEDRSRDIKNQERNRNPENQERSRDLKDQAMSKDLKTTDSSHDAVSLELWMKDGRTVLKRIREFALLEGSAALQHNERSIIWNSILQQYWHLSYQFPVLTLLASSNEPGILLQELGQAIQATAHRFDLEIVAGRYEGGRLDQSELNRTSCVDTGKGKESRVKSILDGDRKFSVDGSGKYGSQKIVGKVIEQVCCELNNVVQNTQNNDKNTSDPSCRVGGLSEEGSHNAVQYSPKELDKRQHGLEKDVTKLQEINENQMSMNEKRVDIGEASALSANIPTEAYQHNCNQVEVKRSTPQVLELGTAVLGGLSSGVPVTEKVEMGTLAVCSPAHSRESLKTVGPLEKVKLWQASLVDPEVPHATYESSNISPAPSILSLNSSQLFDPHVDPSNSLTKLHVDSTQSPNKSGTNLLLDHATKGNSRSVRSKIINYSPQDHSIDCNSPLRSPDRLEFDLPKCSWRSSSATPRLPWGRTIKARDLDSGCPGSEQSPRMSHNASLEQPEQLEMPHFHSSLDATSNVKVSSTILVEPNQGRERDNEEHEEDYAYESENVNKVVSRSSSHSHDHDTTSRGTAEASPPSDVVKMAFPESENCEIENVSCTDIDRKSRALSASRSSINSSKKRIDQHYSHSESQDAILKHRHGRPVSANLVGTNGSNYHRRGKNGNSDSKENTLHEGVVRSRDRDFISDMPYAHQRMKPRKIMEKKTLVGKERSKGFQNDHKMSAFAGKEQNNKSNMMSTMEKDIFKQSNTKKYSTKYVSGNSSDYSDTSVSSQKSSNIYNNITKLKRDLNIIKSQMMNLTSEVFQKKKSKGEGVHSCSNNQSSRLQKRQKPIKALDMSVYSEESEHDSSITSLDPYVHQTLGDQKPWSSKHKATTPAKIKSRNGTKEDFHKQPRSPPLDWNVKDSWQDKSISFPNSSLEMLSESMFTTSKIEKLPRSTPKNKKCQSDRSRKMSPCPVNSRAVNETEDKKCGVCVKRNLFLEDKVKATNVQEYLTDQNQSMKRLPSVHNSTKHVSIQTEKSNNKIILISELVENAALTTGASNEVSTDSTHIKHQGKQPAQTTDGQFLNTTTPVIYIQNYNCRNETSQAGSDAVEKMKSPQRSSDRCKHRRSVSAQELLVSLDEATTLAERLRLRTESMLSYLNLHFTVHVDHIQS